MAWLAIGWLPSAVTAQPAPAQQETKDAIVVTGSRDAPDPVRIFVRTVTVETDEQIATFDLPACPVSIGLPAAYNAVIEERLREIGTRLGIGAGGRGCHPNIAVVAADDGADFVALLRRHRPDLFEDMELPARRAIDRQPGPVRTWQVIEPRGSDGRPLERVSYVSLNGGPGMYIGATRALTTISLSRLTQPVRQDLSLVFVVLDRSILEGLTLRQIADYAAMRAFARTRTIASTDGRSILSLLEDRDADRTPAPELTDWDIAYLTGLYRTRSTVSAHLQRSSIGTFMHKALEDGED